MDLANDLLSKGADCATHEWRVALPKVEQSKEKAKEGKVYICGAGPGELRFVNE